MQGTRRQYEGTHLFLVRLQGEEMDTGQVEWCGKVQRVVSGEAYTFSGWPDLIEHLLTMLPEVSTRHQESSPLLTSENE
jgi:hypothetical protein